MILNSLKHLRIKYKETQKITHTIFLKLRHNKNAIYFIIYLSITEKLYSFNSNISFNTGGTKKAYHTFGIY